MITIVKNEKGSELPAISFPEIGDTSLIPCLRDALLDAVESCVSYKEAKENTNSYTLYILTRMIAELNKDIEKGGKV